MLSNIAMENGLFIDDEHDDYFEWRFSSSLRDK